MAATAADILEVRHYDDHISRYEQVTYCAWSGGVTVYRDGVEIVRHDDVLHTQALKHAKVDIDPAQGTGHLVLRPALGHSVAADVLAVLIPATATAFLCDTVAIDGSTPSPGYSGRGGWS